MQTDAVALASPPPSAPAVRAPATLTKRASLNAVQSLLDYAARLDVIVLLDGADPLLVDRLRSREKDHPLKSSSDRELYEFAAAYRREFEWVISGLTAQGESGPKVISLESNGAPPEELAARVLAACQNTVHAD